MATSPTLTLSTLSSADAFRAYIELVDKCAERRLDFPIANGSAEHARILISKLFEVATGSVKLVTGTLRQFSPQQKVEIYSYSNVIEQAKIFLRREKTSLEIVVQTGELDNGMDNALLRELVNDEYRAGSISIYLPKKDLLGNDIAHFMISDDAAYRMETGVDANPNYRGIAAIANFGDTPTAKTLSTYFDRLKAFLNLDDHLVDHISIPQAPAR